MYASYHRTYPMESFVPVSVEQVFKVPLNGSGHVYTGKFDAIIRYTSGPYSGQLAILEHKSESRSALRNLPEAWAARAQVSLYKYAAESLYNEPIAHILLDVLRRQSPAGREPATFYRDTLERTKEQVEDAVADLRYVADAIDNMARDFYLADVRWPRNTDKCVDGRFKCAYYDLHIGASSPEIVQIQYKEAEEYLGGL